MSQTLLFLGGDSLAAPVLRWAREAGLRVALADPDAHAPLRRAADEFHLVPLHAAEAHVALAQRLARNGRLAGVLATGPASFPLLAPLAAAGIPRLSGARAIERLLDPRVTRDALRAQGFRVAEPSLDARSELELFALFRDGAFVPAGMAVRHTLASGDVCSLQPGASSPAAAHAAYVLVERAARALGYEEGMLQATLVEEAGGPALLALHPGFLDLTGATHVARLAHGKSPFQAWFAHLAGVGGPFDDVPLASHTSAGWLSVTPQRAGLFGGIDGAARARALPGIEGLWLAEPGRTLVSPELPQPPLAMLWAQGHDRAEVEERLLAARARLEVRMAGRQRVA